MVTSGTQSKSVKTPSEFRSEMGQGVMTSIPMIIAAHRVAVGRIGRRLLGADFRPLGFQFIGGEQSTNGSRSIRNMLTLQKR